MTLNVEDEVIQRIVWIPLVPEVENGKYLWWINGVIECYRIFSDHLN